MAHDRTYLRTTANLLPLITGAIYFLAVTITLQLVGGSGGVAISWPASGLLLAVLLVRPETELKRHVAAAAVASFAANLIFGNSPLISVAFTIANMVEPVAIRSVLSTTLKRQISFAQPRDLLWFCIAALAGCALSSAIAVAAVSKPSSEFWFSWFSTDLLGILILTPLIIIGVKAIGRNGPPASNARTFEAAGIFGLVTAVSCAVFWQPGAPILFLPMLVVLIAAARLGPLGAAGGVLIVATIGTLTLDTWSPAQMLFGSGPLAKSLYLQFYLLILFAAALPIAALLASRDRILDRLEEEKRLLELAEETASLGHWWLDVSTEEVRWSQEVFNIFGIEGEVPPILEDAINAYHPDDRGIVTASLEEAIGNRRGFEFTARIIWPDGEIRHVRSRGEIDDHCGDGTFGLFGIVHDITMQVSREAAIVEARTRAEEAARAAKIIAETDQLTGIANRRRVTSDLVQAVLTARRERQPLSIALFDIDHFKRINDTYGHQAGDEVLKRVAATAAGAIRAHDLVGRFGGEEFVVVLPDTTAETAMSVAERVRNAIETGGYTPAVTVSIGIAQLTVGESGENLLQRADQALYVAKREGRNTARLAA
ncbi:diguanylate cyclase [Croceicoccus hydrothermalis]|uniref:sensor domain-containing diguanylate cyclase n=1 Tax=Croceicoccus hydrothermalis TaxID=2867964 RepID=UPI001EFAB412|nr:diguanylate cyclase [Croceicoccus hydrothermalis]